MIHKRNKDFQKVKMNRKEDFILKTILNKKVNQVAYYNR
jgi:hypothetical protein